MSMETTSLTVRGNEGVCRKFPHRGLGPRLLTWMCQTGFNAFSSNASIMNDIDCCSEKGPSTML